MSYLLGTLCLIVNKQRSDKMRLQANQVKNLNPNLIDTQKQRVAKLYGIYLEAMKAAFDEGNRYVAQTMNNGDHDLQSALRVRSYHIDKAAKKYQEYNIESLAQFFNVSSSEIRNATNMLNTL